jgi:hypothetical protein
VYGCNVQEELFTTTIYSIYEFCIKIKRENLQHTEGERFLFCGKADQRKGFSASFDFRNVMTALNSGEGSSQVMILGSRLSGIPAGRDDDRTGAFLYAPPTAL